MRESITLDDGTVIRLKPEDLKPGTVIPMICRSHSHSALHMFLREVSDLAMKWGIQLRGIETGEGSFDREVLMRLIGAQSIREERMNLNPPWIDLSDD